MTMTRFSRFISFILIVLLIGIPAFAQGDEASPANAEIAAEALNESALAGTVLPNEALYNSAEYSVFFKKKKSKENLTLLPGDTVRVEPHDAKGNYYSVTEMRADHPDIADVTSGAEYRVTALNPGKANVYVKLDNGWQLTLKLVVKDPYLPEKIAFPDKSITVTMGSTAKLIPQLSPATAKSELTWKSSKAKVATVSPDGTVTPVGEGTAKITVTTANKKKAAITVKVLDPNKPDSVRFAQKSIDLQVGSTVELVPVLTPATAVTTYTWKSSKPKVATVENGIVTGVSAGTAKITATTANKKKATVTIAVTDSTKPASVVITAPADSVDMGKTIQLSAKVTPDDASQQVTWSSSDTKIATVSADGLVTGVSAGNVTITATAAKGVKATYALQVKQAAMDLTVLLGRPISYARTYLGNPKMTKEVQEGWIVFYLLDGFDLGVAGDAEETVIYVHNHKNTAYTLFGVGIGDDCQRAKSIMSADGWKLERESAGDGNETLLTYGKGSMEVFINYNTSSGKVTYVGNNSEIYDPIC